MGGIQGEDLRQLICNFLVKMKFLVIAHNPVVVYSLVDRYLGVDEYYVGDRYCVICFNIKKKAYLINIIW